MGKAFILVSCTPLITEVHEGYGTCSTISSAHWLYHVLTARSVQMYRTHIKVAK